MSQDTPIHAHRPTRPRWTHLALCVNDIDATIAWYERYTHLTLLARTEDPNGYGAWLGDPEEAESPFVLVLAQFFDGKDPFAPARHAVLGPFAHIGIEVPDKAGVDQVADRGRENECLVLGPMQMPDPIGYICFLKDPDGNMVEFSYDQGVYEKAREIWGNRATQDAK